MRKTLALFILLSAPSFAAERKWHRWLVGAQVASCAASAFDAITTQQALSVPGVSENGVLANNGRGGVSYARIIPLKAAICGAPIVATWIARHRRSDTQDFYTVMVPLSFAPAVPFAWAGVHNLDVIQKQKAINAAAVTR